MWFRRRGKSSVESEKALKEARQNLENVQQRSSEVSKVAGALKEIRERNHFAQQLEEVLLRPRRTS